MNVGVALGSNLGDRELELRESLAFLNQLGRVKLCSSIYESSPVDCTAQSLPFLNAVLEVEFGDGVRYLLEKCQAYELKRGRPGVRERNSPRPVDLDLLYAGELEMNTSTLTLPHPRIQERLFVLKPLAEIRPDLILPGQVKKVSDLLADLEAVAHDQICQKKGPLP
ncbi:MAG: 2-amino-4-hydroxy-6-hydroxymethyldihydropteridine diphosphokinase [Blastochloris sp.]|nr:2-amino-4-hydroxy-6-hydroxymethyldihydropteridine diphosphokinase [Blastochloris sp.]